MICSNERLCSIVDWGEGGREGGVWGSKLCVGSVGLAWCDEMEENKPKQYKTRQDEVVRPSMDRCTTQPLPVAIQ